MDFCDGGGGGVIGKSYELGFLVGRYIECADDGFFFASVATVFLLLHEGVETVHVYSDGVLLAEDFC